MKPLAALVLVFAAAGLCGCGQKGPLVRPGKHPPAVPVSQPAATTPVATPGTAPGSAPP